MPPRLITLEGGGGAFWNRGLAERRASHRRDHTPPIVHAGQEGIGLLHNRRHVHERATALVDIPAADAVGVLGPVLGFTFRRQGDPDNPQAFRIGGAALFGGGCLGISILPPPRFEEPQSGTPGPSGSCCSYWQRPRSIQFQRNVPAVAPITSHCIIDAVQRLR